MLQFKVLRIIFSPFHGNENTQTVSHTFLNKLTNLKTGAHLALNGFDIKFTKDARPFYEVKIDCSDLPVIKSDQKTVEFKVTILLKCHPVNIDDKYEGWVDVLLIAE
jgi:hypothetical protein